MEALSMHTVVLGFVFGNEARDVQRSDGGGFRHTARGLGNSKEGGGRRVRLV